MKVKTFFSLLEVNSGIKELKCRHTYFISLKKFWKSLVDICFISKIKESKEFWTKKGFCGDSLALKGFQHISENKYLTHLGQLNQKEFLKQNSAAPIL